MTRPLTLLLLVLSLCACFGSHGSEDDPSDDGLPLLDAGRLDAGFPGSHDLGPTPVPLDAGPLPAECTARRADLSCGLIPYPSNVAFELPVSIGGAGECYCGETVRCDVAIRPGPDGRPVELDLATSFCVDGALCDACFPYIDGKCEVPPLPAGGYPVWVNGERAFDIRVEGADFIGQESCTTVAEADTLGCGPVSWPARTFEPGEVCHPERVAAGTRSTIRVVDTCATCGQQPGPCSVTVDESGFAPALHVETTTTYTACDVDCPSICMRLEHECVVPAPLAGSGSYGVVVNGLDFGTRIEVGTPSPGEVCASRLIRRERGGR